MADDNLILAATSLLEGFTSAYLPYKKAQYESDLLTKRKQQEILMQEASAGRTRPEEEASKIRIAQARPRGQGVVNRETGEVEYFDQPVKFTPQDQQPPEVPVKTAEQMREIAEKSGTVPPGTKVAPGLGIVQSEEEKYSARERAKQFAKKPQATLALKNALRNIDLMISDTENIERHPSLGIATGATSLIGKIPGTGAKNVHARISSLKSKIGFNTLQAMREASKTGGALGNVSDKETELLQNNLASLDPEQAESDFRISLQSIASSGKATKQEIG